MKQFSADDIRLPAPAIIKVIGLGGGGSNAVDRMIDLGIQGIEFIAANTDAQALSRCLAPTKIQLGPGQTRGQGAGGNPDIGEAAAEESQAALAEALGNADMVFLAAGMGGGTGTGAIPVAAEVAREAGAVTVAVVTTPFAFEGTWRERAAQAGIVKLRQKVDTLISVPNDRLLEVLPRTVSFEVAFRVADDVLRQGVQGIAELITRPGLINVDFAHVRRLMKISGGALLAIGNGRGPNKAVDAAQQAIHHPLLELGAMDQASGLLVHFTGGDDLALHEVDRAIQVITRAANPDAEVVFGATIDLAVTGRAQVILVATGVGGQPLNEVVAGAADMIISRRRPSGSGMDQPVEEAEVLEEAPSGSTGRGAEPALPLRRPLQWVVAEEAGARRANFDLPAFLRRQRGL